MIEVLKIFPVLNDSNVDEFLYLNVDDKIRGRVMRIKNINSY